MSEYIDRALIPWRDEVFEERCHNDVWDVKVKIVSKAEVDRIPAANVRPVVRGKDVCSSHDSHCEFKCSECGAWAGEVAYGTLDGGRFNFCPNCGADMRPEPPKEET